MKILNSNAFYRSHSKLSHKVLYFLTRKPVGTHCKILEKHQKYKVACCQVVKLCHAPAFFSSVIAAPQLGTSPSSLFTAANIISCINPLLGDLLSIYPMLISIQIHKKS
jgi:hypothetical protein